MRIRIRGDYSQIPLSVKFQQKSNVLTFGIIVLTDFVRYLLKKTDRTVLDIACECGFDNGSKFAKAFREVMGSVPSKYR